MDEPGPKFSLIKMPWGKYRGQPIEDVPDDYLVWMADPRQHGSVDSKFRLCAYLEIIKRYKACHTATTAT